MTDGDRSLRADEAFRCLDCDRRWYYARARCPDCAGREFGTYALDEGVVVARTTVHTTPPDVRSPNALGFVRFDNGVQVVAQLSDDAVGVGDTVAFAGSTPLRDGDAPQPRLVSVTE